MPNRRAHDRTAHKRLALLFAAAVAGVSTAPGCRAEPASAATTARAADPALPPGCSGPAVATGGHRSLALLVGVGDYAAADKLLGPKNDVEAMRRLLVEQYGFPAANVCTLIDGQATTAAFRKAFDTALVDRAQRGDVAVFYFAGHGSQARDGGDRDEPDGWDETILLQDARSGDVHDLVDDELNGMLARLYAKTETIAVLLDSCNSGTATRSADASTARARVQPPQGAAALRTTGPTAGLADPWVPAEMEHAVVFTAAADGTSAIETDGKGVFTTALVHVLSEPRRDPLTWAAAARRIPQLVRASSAQVPYFQGDLERDVFGTAAWPRPPSWEVRSLGPQVEIAGPPLPGMGKGAELRIYPARLPPAAYVDPARSKGVLIVTEPKGLTARGDVILRARAPAVREGDLALLVRPSDDALRISVRLRPAKAAGDGGLDAATIERLRKAIAEDPDARTSAVVVGDGPGAFELSRMNGMLVLRGPEDHVRNVYGSERDVPRSLWQHARQRALLALDPEGGEDFVANDTLQVQIVPAPAAEQTDCGKRSVADWAQSPPNGDQVVPLCAAWKLKVKLQKSATKPVLVGGVILSSDGATLGFPRDRSALLLQPGEEKTLPQAYFGKPPLDTDDVVRVFGTQETNPVGWRLLTTDATTRSASRGAFRGALHRALDRYLTVGARGTGEVNAPAEDTTWTATTVRARVEANARFAKPESAAAPPAAREYTLADFDLRPYLSEDARSPLDKVLAQASELARTQVGYRQHLWEAASDADNLKLGIDCSRAVWFAFTRAGLRYNSRSPESARPAGFSKDYLTTADMVAPGTPMADLFDRCSPDDPRLGDLLVYRDDERGDGHVVMVIDPPKRIAWGSHGWDGNAAELKVAPQTGVEFQRIKYKPDWDRWDRKKMVAKACWRYRAFPGDVAASRGVALSPGASPCDAKSCPPRAAPVVLGSR